MNKRHFSRYHVARFFELHYGAGLSLRRLGRLTGCNPGAISRAISLAKAGYVYPEVTPRFISFERCHGPEEQRGSTSEVVK